MGKKFINKKTITLTVIFTICGFLLIQGFRTNKEQPVNGIVQYVNAAKPVSYDYIHHMTNSVIKANEKWGSIKINKDNIEKVKKSYLYETNEVVKKNIDEWEQGDFTNADKFHNYIWGLLGGTVGKATGIDRNAVEKARIELGFN